MGFDDEFDLETQVFDPAGERKAIQKMHARNLTVDQITGDLHADGPGWVSSVHRRGNWSPGAATAAAPAVPAPEGLEYLRVHFFREVVGRLHDGELEFLGRIRSLYGPVDTWDQTLDDQRPLGPEDKMVVLTCDRLAVADMSDHPGSLENPELEATGNALVRGSSYSASGQRISYARAKDQLVLEGDGRNDATLTYQPQVGAPPAELKSGKILFWPGTRQFELNDVRSLDVRDLNQLRLPRSP